MARVKKGRGELGVFPLAQVGGGEGDRERVVGEACLNQWERRERAPIGPRWKEESGEWPSEQMGWMTGGPGWGRVVLAVGKRRER